MIFTFAKEGDGTSIEDNQANVGVEFQAMTLPVVLSHFEDFLRGCGFVFDGHLTILGDEDDCK
jgi:hypothetical protein